VAINAVIQPSQLYRLEKLLWEVNPRIQVWDRVDLILNIFDLHAHTTEAKLQIELAKVQHLGPRIYGLGGTVLSRQGSGVGARGAGETNVELEKRKLKKQKQQIQAELAERTEDQLKRIHERKEQGLKTVALVGYTSAGKTSLFNTLTGKQAQTDKSLFTTLDSTVGKLKMEHPTQIIISDTIGFIDQLPPALIQAFRSTLLESLEAQLLLHVIDAADDFMEHKFEVVEQILQDLGVDRHPILVFNKSDLLSQDQRTQIREKFADREIMFVSAKTGQYIEELKLYLSSLLQQQGKLETQLSDLLAELKKKYPKKLIILNDTTRPTELICEVDPTARHPEYSVAVAVIEKSQPHVHHQITETYKVLKGTLTLHLGEQEQVLEQGQVVVIEPGQVHWAEGNCAWVQCTSEPGWTIEDHNLV